MTHPPPSLQIEEKGHPKIDIGSRPDALVVEIIGGDGGVGRDLQVRTDLKLHTADEEGCRRGRIIFMSEDPDFRANLGCVNGRTFNTKIFVDLYDDSGTLLETKTMDLAPWSNNQLNKIFKDYAPINGYAIVRATKSGAAYYCYGSVLDNSSSDPTTIVPVLQ